MAGADADLDLAARLDHHRVENRHLALGGVLLVGLVLRAYGLGAESLWFDEVFTAEVVAFGSLEYIVFELPRVDPHPTFYYVLLKGWTALFGTSEVGLRSFSVVADAGSILLVYALGRRLADRRVGLVGSLLFALSPFYVYYGREARMYALATLLALASWYLLVRMGQGDRRWRTAGAYALASAALAHTHAFAPLAVAAQNAYLAGALVVGWYAAGGFPRRIGDLSVARWVGLQVVVGAVAAPYYYVLYRQTFVTERLSANVGWIPEPTTAMPWHVLGTYVGRTAPPVEPWGRETLWAAAPVVGELVTLAALVAMLYGLVGYRSGDRGPFAAEPLLAAWAVLPPAALYLLAVSVRPVFYDRFTAPFGVAALLLAALGLVRAADALAERFGAGATDEEATASSADGGRLASGGPAGRPALVGVALAVAVVLAVPLAGLHAGPQKQQARQAVDVVESNAEDGDLVVITPRWDSSYDYYLQDWPQADERPRGTDAEFTVERVPAFRASVELRGAAAGHDVVWLVVSFMSEEGIQRLVATMETSGYEVDRHEDLEKVDVYRFVATEA